MTRLLLLTLAFTPALAAQTPVFEVASIKPHKPDPTGSAGVSAQHGRLNAMNVTLQNLIMSAYELHEFQVSGGPAWIDSERYDLVAKAENDAGGKELWMMVRPLLAERFKLAVHTETKDLPVYDLVVGKRGSKLHPAAADAQGNSRMGGGSFTAERISMPRFSSILSSIVDRPVLDKTGLDGDFAVKFDWLPRDPDGGPSIFTALEDQLGLKLESRRGPVENLVIDHVERPSGN
jgi:uncharacterized protein (TIGR03435 family)